MPDLNINILELWTSNDVEIHLSWYFRLPQYNLYCNLARVLKEGLLMSEKSDAWAWYQYLHIYKYKVVYGTIQNVDVFMTQCTDRGEITKSF